MPRAIAQRLLGSMLLAPLLCFVTAGFAAADGPTGPITYDGTWTLTTYESDREIFLPEHTVGEVAPGSIVLDCDAGTGCAVQFKRDGFIVFDGQMVLEPDGSLSAEEEAPGGCTGGSETLTRTVTRLGTGATATDARTYEPLSCEQGSTTVYFIDETWSFSGEVSSIAPEGSATSPALPTPTEGTASPTPGDLPSGPAGSGDGAPGGQTGHGVPFDDSIPAVSQVSTDPVVLLQSVALAALVVFLMPFPSQLFNSTLEEHEDEVRRWFRLDRLGAAAAGVGRFWASWPGVAVFTLLAALLYGFLDPAFGLDSHSLAVLIGMLAGIVVVTVAFAAPAVLAHRRIGDRPSAKVVPISLAVGIGCVLVSRLTGFQPGYLYGLLIGLAFGAELSATDEGRSTALGAALMLAAAFASWFALGVVPEGDGFILVAARTTLAALMVAGLEGVVFGLLPMRFLPGQTLYAWNRPMWGVLLGIGALAFFHILINPASGYLADASRTPLFTVVALLVAFSLLSIAFWAWFRYRVPAASPATDPDHG